MAVPQPLGCHVRDTYKPPGLVRGPSTLSHRLVPLIFLSLSLLLLSHYTSVPPRTFRSPQCQPNHMPASPPHLRLHLPIPASGPVRPTCLSTSERKPELNETVSPPSAPETGENYSFPSWRHGWPSSRKKTESCVQVPPPSHRKYNRSPILNKRNERKRTRS